jgi:hypothetical protein
VLNEGVRWNALSRDDATVIRLTDELAAHPHILHFEGYVSFPSELDSDIAVFFSSLTSTTEAAHWSRFGNMLRDNKVQLLVAGRNEGNRTFRNVGAAISYHLMNWGAVPAVLAPIRAIDNATATSLTTEFYRAFAVGSNLEQALHIARRKVASRGGDWTPFALFANPSVLDFFQPLPATP